jgi:hypothetical protein
MHGALPTQLKALNPVVAGWYRLQSTVQRKRTLQRLDATPGAQPKFHGVAGQTLDAHV